MVKNNKLIETLFTCVKNKNNCKGCFYGDGSTIPECQYHLMNDILFFFRNPVPSKDATVIQIEDLQEALSDKKDHLCFAEFINSIHVAQPVIRTITLKKNVFTLHDPQSNETDQFLLSDYYTKFRVWSTKPTDALRNSTPFAPSDGSLYEDEPSPINQSKTESLLNFIQKMT